MSFCVYYGQSNYPKVIFTKNVRAIKEHFTNFCCFQNKFFSTLHTLVVTSPSNLKLNLHPTWPHSNELLYCPLQLQDHFLFFFREGKNCCLRHGAGSNFPSILLPLLTRYSLPFIIIIFRHSLQRKQLMSA